MLAPAAVIVRPADGLERTQDAKMLYTKASCTGSSDTAVMEGGLDLLVRQPFEHEADHAHVEPSLAGSGQELTIFAHPHLCSSSGCVRSRRRCAEQSTAAGGAESRGAESVALGPLAATVSGHQAARPSAGANPASPRPRSALAPRRCYRPRSTAQINSSRGKVLATVSRRRGALAQS